MDEKLCSPMPQHSKFEKCNSLQKGTLLWGFHLTQIFINSHFNKDSA